MRIASLFTKAGWGMLGVLMLAGQAGLASASTRTSQHIATWTRARGDLPVLTRATARQATTAMLAARLLPPGEAERITEHELGQPIFDGGPLPSVTFFARPEPLNGDLCVRDTYYVDLKRIEKSDIQTLDGDVPVVPASVSEKKQIALAPGCRLKPKAFFAWVQPAGSFEDAVSALRRLAEFQRAAKAGKPIPVVTCTAVAAGNDCGTARADLARLPLDRIFVIQPLRDGKRRGWEFAVMPEGSGKPFWEVNVEEISGEPPVICLEWRTPAPF